MTTPPEPLEPDTLPAASPRANPLPGFGVVGRDQSAHRSWAPAVDVLAWAFVAAAILLARAAPTFRPDIYHDSFQYFSVAKNTLRGLFGQTSILHFDAERSFGTIPAPQVTVALGSPWSQQP